MRILDRLFGTLGGGVCLTDGAGRILYMNAAARRMLGLEEGRRPQEALCDLLCARLTDGGAGDCASRCPLRRPRSPEKAVDFDGQHGPHVAYEWREPEFHRVERWENLRVRCLRLPAGRLAPWKSELHLTLIEEI